MTATLAIKNLHCVSIFVDNYFFCLEWSIPQLLIHSITFNPACVNWFPQKPKHFLSAYNTKEGKETFSSVITTLQAFSKKTICCNNCTRCTHLMVAGDIVTYTFSFLLSRVYRIFFFFFLLTHMMIKLSSSVLPPRLASF